MTCEEYVVRRVQDLEEENHGLWLEMEAKKKELTETRADIDLLLSMINYVVQEHYDGEYKLADSSTKTNPVNFHTVYNLKKKYSKQKEDDDA